MPHEPNHFGEQEDMRILRPRTTVLGVQVFETVPAHDAPEGSFVFYKSGSIYRLYSRIDGAWRQIGSQSTVEALACTDFAATGRHNQVIQGTYAINFGVNGMELASGVLGSSGSARADWRLGFLNGWEPFLRNFTFSTTLTIDSATLIANSTQILLGVGNWSVEPTGIGVTDNHIGFYVNKTGGTANLVGSVANGATQTTTATIATVTNGDDLEIIADYVAATRVDFYARLNGGALSSAFTVSTNLPGSDTGILGCVFSSSSGGSNDQAGDWHMLGASFRRG